MKIWLRGLALYALISFSGLVSSNALAAERSVEPERCVQLSRVKSTDVLSNKQIVFEMRSGLYFINALPYACPGMRRGSTIMYRTSIDLLCDVDIVTVLETFGGGFQPGASCGLGKFEPVEKSEVIEMRKAGKE